MKQPPPLPPEMAKTYRAKELEQPLYDWWEAQGYFRPKIVPGQ